MAEFDAELERIEDTIAALASVSAACNVKTDELRSLIYAVCYTLRDAFLLECYRKGNCVSND